MSNYSRFPSSHFVFLLNDRASIGEYIVQSDSEVKEANTAV